jgi:phage gp36-like protein
MSWQTPTTDDLLASLSASELDEIGSKGAAIGQAATDQILTRTVWTIRGFVRTTGVTLGPTGTIPSELLAACCDIAATDVFLRLAIPVTEQRDARRRDAMTTLRDLAEGRGISVLGYGEDEPGPVLPSFTAIDRTTGRDHEEGL